MSKNQIAHDLAMLVVSSMYQEAIVDIPKTKESLISKACEVFADNYEDIYNTISRASEPSEEH